MPIPLKLQIKRKRSAHAFFGPSKHSSVQTCLWTKKALLGQGFCYKHAFYGLQSHRCIQWSPSVPHCNLACRFCWRDIAIHSPTWQGPADDPEELADGSIKEFKHLLNGFPGNPKIVPQRMQEALQPIHAAISLDGEPTLYPHLPALIRAFRHRGITTFLVSNGTHTEVLQKLEQEESLPTQMYLSLSSWDETSFKKIQQPLQPGLWDKYLESLDWMRHARHERRVLRMTLAQGLNLSDESLDGFSNIIKQSGAEYVEVKSYTAVGKSRQRLGLGYMPQHEDMQNAAQHLANKTGYLVTAEHRQSRVVLLCKDGKAQKNRRLDLKKLCGEKRANE